MNIVNLLLVFQDMTSRELLQQRSTLPNGDTTWRTSPLITAALKGRLAVLDGVHRLDAGTLAVLKRYSHLDWKYNFPSIYIHTLRNTTL